MKEAGGPEHTKTGSLAICTAIERSRARLMEASGAIARAQTGMRTASRTEATSQRGDTLPPRDSHAVSGREVQALQEVRKLEAGMGRLARELAATREETERLRDVIRGFDAARTSPTKSVREETRGRVVSRAIDLQQPIVRSNPGSIFYLAG